MLIETAKKRYDKNGLEYHNWDHVLRVENWLGPVVPNYQELAAIFHDYVYDKEPHKEYRSAIAMHNWCVHFDELGINKKYTKEDVTKAFVCILATSNHKLDEWPKYTWPVIRADLSDLTIPNRTRENFYKIKTESMKLYGVSEQEFATANIEFMTNLRLTVLKNSVIDIQNKGFWYNVSDGCELTIDLARELE